MAGIKAYSQFDMKVAPTAPSHLARLQDVLSLVSGNTLTPIRVVSTANIAGTYESTGKTLTQTTPAEFVIDGVTLSLNDRILVTGQTDKTQNGVYVVTTLGVTSATAGVLTRSTDFDEDAELVAGRRFPISDGTAHAGETWKLTGTGPFTLDSSNLEFAVDIAKYTEIAEKVETLVGDSGTVSYPVTHDFDTKNVTVEIYDSTTGDTVCAQTTRTSVNDITVTLGEPLGAGNDLVVVIRAVVSPV